MIRIFLFFALLLAAAFGIVWLAETPGHVIVNYGGFDYQVSLLKALTGIVLVSFALLLIWTAIRLVFRLPGILSLANRMRRRTKGYSAVSRGLISLGVGDRRNATRFAGEAERLLGSEPLSLLLKAQAAQLSGDRQGAEHTFTRMLDDPETRVLGLRGLFVEARRKGSDAARKYAEEAYRIAPAAPWAGEATLEYRCADGDWRGAIAAVDQNASRRTIDRDTAKRQKAALLAAQALALAAKSPDDALRAALDALKLNPGQVPAAVLAAKALSARGDYSKATRLLETAWKLGQHQDLAEAYLSVRHGDSGLDRLKRARNLANLTPNAREAKLAVARAAIDAQEFPVARETLEPLVLEQPTARACHLMAELEDRDSGNAGMVRRWLSRAAHAPRDPAWIADGFISETWAPVSPVTGKLDAFVWMTPPQSLETSVRATMDADRFTDQIPASAVLAPAILVSSADPAVKNPGPHAHEELPDSRDASPVQEKPLAAPSSSPVAVLDHAPEIGRAHV